MRYSNRCTEPIIPNVNNVSGYSADQVALRENLQRKLWYLNAEVVNNQDWGICYKVNKKYSRLFTDIVINYHGGKSGARPGEITSISFWGIQGVNYDIANEVFSDIISKYNFNRIEKCTDRVNDEFSAVAHWTTSTFVSNTDRTKYVAEIIEKCCC